MSSGGKTYAVRNTYGHIEYLTEEEIENLHERGEDVEVVGSYSGHPPLARNPANQASVNRLWYEKQEEKARKRKERKGKASYGRGSQSGAYGRSAYAMKEGTFDGHPSLSRRRDDGTLDIFYGPELDLDDPMKGHAVIRKGKLISKRRPGEAR